MKKKKIENSVVLFGGPLWQAEPGLVVMGKVSSGRPTVSTQATVLLFPRYIMERQGWWIWSLDIATNLLLLRWLTNGW